jgi:hypothetical protein
LIPHARLGATVLQGIGRPDRQRSDHGVRDDETNHDRRFDLLYIGVGNGGPLNYKMAQREKQRLANP